MSTLRFIRLAPLAIGALVLATSCDEDASSPETPDNPSPVFREVRDVDYVHNTYFYFDDPRAFIGPQSRSIGVWRTVLPIDFVDDPTILRFPGWAIPDPDGTGQAIRDAVTALNNGQLPAVGVEHDFKWLELGTHYAFVVNAASDSILGIELFEPIPDTEFRSLAVSYTNLDGQLVGGSYSQLGVLKNGQPIVPGSADDHLLLEMVKAPVPDPQGIFASTWRLEMRNVYDLGLANIKGSSLVVEIADNLSPRVNPSYPQGSDVPYLRIFGLDQTDGLGTGPPDGRIDLARVDLDAGLLWFPSLEPFHPDPDDVTAWTAGQFAFTNEYQAQYDKSLAIYTEKLTQIQELEVHQYMIRVTADTLCVSAARRILPTHKRP